VSPREFGSLKWFLGTRVKSSCTAGPDAGAGVRLRESTEGSLSRDTRGVRCGEMWSLDPNTQDFLSAAGAVLRVARPSLLPLPTPACILLLFVFLLRKGLAV
jgi:hypothetical protein